MSDTWLVVGLGNPGANYVATRHNVGFMVSDYLLESNSGGKYVSHKSRNSLADYRLAGSRVILAKPLTYMNLSGVAVVNLMNFFDIAVDRLIVVHDELDISLGVLKLKSSGGAAGHNGLRSISKSLGADNYIRLRVGISRPVVGSDVANYVLQNFSSGEKRILPDLVAAAAEVVESIVLDGFISAQQKLHSIS